MDKEGVSGTSLPTDSNDYYTDQISTNEIANSTRPPSMSQATTSHHQTNAIFDNNVGSSMVDEAADATNSTNDDKKPSDNDENLGLGNNSQTSNLFLTMINLCNMIIGSGVIVLANALSQSGIFLGIILLIFSAMLTDFSIMALAKSGALTDKFTYQSVVNKALGKPGIIVVTICQIVYPIFAVVSYSIAIRDNIRDIVAFSAEKLIATTKSVPWYLDDRFLLCIVTFAVIFPLASMRNISKLDKASCCSVLLVFVYIGCVMYNVFVVPQKMFCRSGFISYSRTGFVSTINVYAFALSCQHNVLPMFRSMRGMSVKKFGLATHLALIVTTILYIIVALTGYLTFTGDASGNLLKDYCSGNIVILVARIAFSLTVTLTSPLQIYSCREAISTLLYKVVDFTWIIHFALTFGIITICYLGAIFISDIKDVISLSGSFVAAPVVFILPALSLLLLMRQGLRINNYTKFGCAVTFIFGVLVLVVGSSVSIYNFVKTQPVRIKYWCDENYVIYPEEMREQFNTQIATIKALWGIQPIS